jgi:tetratricopeptide (TPR) repeat protein
VSSHAVGVAVGLTALSIVNAGLYFARFSAPEPSAGEPPRETVGVGAAVAGEPTTKASAGVAAPDAAPLAVRRDSPPSPPKAVAGGAADPARERARASSRAAAAAESHVKRGTALLKRRKAQPAAEAALAAIAADPSSATAYRLLGLSYAALGRDDEAVAALERFVGLAPNHPAAGEARAILKAYRDKVRR